MSRAPMFVVLAVVAAALVSFGCKGGAIPFGDEAQVEVPPTNLADSTSIDVNVPPTTEIEETLENQICETPEVPGEYECPTCVRALPIDADVVVSISPQRLMESEIVKSLLEGDVGTFLQKLQQKYMLPFAHPLQDIQHVCLACKLREQVKPGMSTSENASSVGGTTDVAGTAPADQESPIAAAKKRPGLLSHCAEFAIVIEGELPANFDLKQFITEKSGSTPSEIGDNSDLLIVGGVKERPIVATMAGGKLIAGTLASVEGAVAAIAANANECPMKAIYAQVPDAGFKAAGDLIVFSRMFRDLLEKEQGDPLAAIFSYNAKDMQMVASAEISSRLVLAAKAFSREKVELVSEVLLRMNATEMAKGILASWIQDIKEELFSNSEPIILQQGQQSLNQATGILNTAPPQQQQQEATINAAQQQREAAISAAPQQAQQAAPAQAQQAAPAQAQQAAPAQAQQAAPTQAQQAAPAQLQQATPTRNLQIEQMPLRVAPIGQ